MRTLIQILLTIQISILIIIAVPNQSRSQILRCGVEDLNQQQLQQLRDAFNEWLSQGNRVQDGGIVTIPVAFHIVRYDNGSSDVLDSKILQQLNVLNSSYSNTNFRFSLHSINRVNNTAWTTHRIGSQEEIQMKNSLSIDPARVLNFYICASPKNNSGNELLGYATFPWSYPENSKMHGVVVHTGSLPDGYLTNYNEGDTGTHEVGHFLGLFHTFQLGCTEPGDEVDDTPYEASPAFGCPVGRNTCPQPGDDPIHNFMDYTYDSCMDHFTNGQEVRTIQVMSQYRPTMMLQSQVAVIIDQRNSFNQQVGLLKKWEGTNWSNPFNPGVLFNFQINTQQTILGDQSLISNEKYNKWTTLNSGDEPDILNHHTFIVNSSNNNDVWTSKFNSAVSNIIIKNLFEQSTLNGGNIQFKDPWLIDYPDPQYGNTLRNRGMDAPFKQRPSPFYPDYTTSYNGDVYKGVFLNQSGPSYNWQPPYYSVKADAVQDIFLEHTGRTHRFYFQGWSATPQGSAEFQNANALEIPVVFKQAGATVQANF